MKLRLKGLSEGMHRQFCEQPAKDLGFEDEAVRFASPIRADFILEKISDQIVCRIQVNTSLELECSRCTEPVKADICEEMTLLLTFSAATATEATGGEFKVVPMGADEVDVTEEVRQTILLAIPIKPLCNVDCRGLCPQCGINLNLGECRCQERVSDARWSGLQKFLPNGSKGDISGTS